MFDWIKRLSGFRRSIQIKVFLTFILLLSLTLVSMTWIWYSNTAKLLKQNAMAYAMDNIRDANHSLDLMMNDLISVVTLVSMNQESVISVVSPGTPQSEYERLLRRSKIESFLSSLYTFHNSIMAINVISARGDRYTAGDSRVYYSKLEELWLPDIRESHGKLQYFHVSLHSGLDTQSEESDMVVVGQSIMKNGTIVGYVFMYLRYSAISSLFLQSLDGTDLLILDTNEKIMYATNRSIKRYLAGNDVVKEQLSAIHAQGGSHYFEEEDRLVLLYRSEQTGWTTMGTISLGTLLKDSKRLRDAMFRAEIAIVAVLLLLSLAASRQTTAHIRQLSRAMRAVENGNLHMPDIPKTDDEIGHLTTRFRSMIATIHGLIEDIKVQEKRKREVELQSLQAQIHPHFLYNTLNTIRYLAKLQQVPNIEKVTGSLIGLLRSAAGRSKELITVREELEHIADYINIQRFRYMDDFEVVYKVKEELLDCLVLPLLLQPLVENALLHGLASRKGLETGRIDIQIDSDAAGRTLICRVFDNGVGIAGERLDDIAETLQGHSDGKMTGVGLHNIHERIQLFFGEQFGLQMISREGEHTIAELKLPIARSDSRV